MKRLGLVILMCSAMALVSCGDDASPDDPDGAKGATATQPKAGEERSLKPNLPKPVIDPPSPLPKKLTIQDLREGAGPVAERGDILTVAYLAVDPSGKERYSSWKRGGEPIIFKVGGGEFFPGWDRGFAGMRVGGRREVFFPARLTGNFGPLLYVIDLLKIE